VLKIARKNRALIPVQKKEKSESSFKNKPGIFAAAWRFRNASRKTKKIQTFF